MTAHDDEFDDFLARVDDIVVEHEQPTSVSRLLQHSLEISVLARTRERDATDLHRSNAPVLRQQSAYVTT